MTDSTTGLAPRAGHGERACNTVSDDRKYICTAVRGHAGDHVPYGAMDLREHTWPQKAAPVPAWLPGDAELAEPKPVVRHHATTATLNVHMRDTKITVEHYDGTDFKPVRPWSSIDVGAGVALFVHSAAQCDALIAAAQAARAHVTGTEDGGNG